MNTESQNSEDLHPLTPAVFHILLSLTDADRHGYAIMKEVEARTEGRLLLKPGTLYQAIGRLLEMGLVEELTERKAHLGERRRVYRLSPSGRQAVISEARRLEEMVKQAYRKKIFEGSKTKIALGP